MIPNVVMQSEISGEEKYFYVDTGNGGAEGGTYNLPILLQLCVIL